MPAYWWECESCGNTVDFTHARSVSGMPRFIREVLILSDWDQGHLLRECSQCGQNSLRIAYEFPRCEKESIRVFHIVGIVDACEEYIPMMWETLPAPYDGEHWYDFKYINGLNIWGLNKPAVFTRGRLVQLFNLYCQKTGVARFP